MSKTDVDIDELASAISRGCNVQVHSDGGFRRGRGASMAWATTIWQPRIIPGKWER